MIYRLPQVLEVVVVARPIRRSVDAVVAVVVVKQGHVLDEHAVLAHCATVMTGLMLPMRVVFAEALPKNQSRKLLKRQLREAQAAVFANP